MVLLMRNVGRIENMIQRHKERSSEMKKEKPNKQLTKKKKERETERKRKPLLRKEYWEGVRTKKGQPHRAN